LKRKSKNKQGREIHVTLEQTKGGLNMRTTGFDKASMDRVIQESLIEKIEAVSCPKCHKIATNISMENGKLRFEACCKELRTIIMNKIKQGSL